MGDFSDYNEHRLGPSHSEYLFAGMNPIDQDEIEEGDAMEEDEEDLDDGAVVIAPTQGEGMLDRDICAACKRPGLHLISCDGSCNQDFHLKCVGLRNLPAGRWLCGDCSIAPSLDESEDQLSSGKLRPTQRRRVALQALFKKNWG